MAKMTRLSVCLGCMLAVLTGGPAPAWASSGGTVARWGHGTVSPVTLHLPGPVAEVGTSNNSEYALLTNGTVWAWGSGHRGELGNGSTHSSAKPVQVEFPAGVKIASIPTDAMPWDTAFAIDTTGHVWGWGANRGGELCLGNTDSYSTPVELPLSDVTAVAGAYQHASYDAAGTLYSCGQNVHGQLGDGSHKQSLVPARVHGLSGRSVTTLVSGFNNMGALLSGGQYYDWGWNGGGQLGDGTVGGSSDVPVQVKLPAAVTQAVQGGDVPRNGGTLVELSDGSVYAWGHNGAGQLGTGNRTSEPSPVQIFPPAGVTYMTLATGGDTSYAVTTTGQVYAWGGNYAGQLGDGSKTPSIKPVLVESGATSLISATSTEVAVSLSS
jgi:alpha-tubulin suppressor-like RCC1 family protein